jgi:hypothetical protein
MSIAIILICLVFFDIFRSYKVEDFRRIGNLVISNKGIQIFTNDNEVFYPINKIKKVTFRINETSVDSVISFNLGVFKTKEGIDNEIEIIDTNDLKLKYKVFIKDQLWLRLIDGVLLIWSNVNVVKIKRNKVTTKLSD